MPLKCPRCSRLNPAEALFCFLDGAALGDPSRRRVSADPGKARFPMPFVFPSGKACHSFDELTLTIYSHWQESRQLLSAGVFASFLAALGRADLAMAARDLSAHSDSERALDGLVQGWPTGVLDPPRLVVEPGQLNLGSMRVGQDFRFDLHLSNRGMGLLTGAVTCEDAPWLVLGGEGAHSRKKLFQILHDTTIPVLVRGKSFLASRTPLVGRLRIDSSAGQVVVPVSVEVPVTPFPEGVLAGAVTPRHIAQKAREQPKESADLFAQGAVARWYQTNGWIYPVQDPSASGLAAVQQFFEALGLTAPPKVDVSSNELRLSGRGGDILRESLQIVAREKKPVWAHVVSNSPWLTVSEVELDGRTATVHLRVPEVPDRAGQTLHALVSITSNGRQRFMVPVHLTVTAPMPLALKWAHDNPVIEPVGSEPPIRRHLPEVVPEVLPDIKPIEPAPPSRKPAPMPEVTPEPIANATHPGRYALAALPVLFLTCGLLTTLVRDLATWRPREGDLSRLPLAVSLHFHDEELPVQVTEVEGVALFDLRSHPDSVPARWEPSMRFGLELAGDPGGGEPKRLTYDRLGRTNNTVVRLDGAEWIFGERPFRRLDGRPIGDWPGRWQERDGRSSMPMRNGRRSVWVYDSERVTVTQTVGLVAGAQSGRVDTCLVHYRLDNRDSRQHTVGIRFLLDTLIGANDGVPFLIPGSTHLCNTMHDFRTPAEVPDFIQARETEDLERPGTIALLQLKPPGFETPSRVTLGAWPNPDLGRLCKQEKTLWSVPLSSMKYFPLRLPIRRQQGDSDSAVVLYWDEKPLAPGGSREVAFLYGLGNVEAGEAGGQLGLSAAGSFTPGGEFTLTAEVRQPVAGQTLTLMLPEGFTRLGGKGIEPVPPLAAGSASPLSPVTWRIKAGGQTGTHRLQVTSSTNVKQSLAVQIRVRGIFGN